MNTNTFICELSKENQDKIKELLTLYLVKEGYSDDEIKDTILNVMDNRLCMLEDSINIEQFLDAGKVINIRQFFNK